jgi:hypothetical protein
VCIATCDARSVISGALFACLERNLNPPKRPTLAKNRSTFLGFPEPPGKKSCNTPCFPELALFAEASVFLLELRKKMLIFTGSPY